MKVVEGYFDYCISEQCVKSGDVEKLAEFLYELGYRTVAVNQTVNEANVERKKKKKKGEQRDVADVVPPPLELKKYCDKLQILNRLTIIFSNQDIINKIIKSPNYVKYDIIAMLPTTQSAFQFTCSNVDADILTFDPETKISYKMNRRLYNQLVQKGYHFEILYGPAILDSGQRKNTIHLSHLYHALGKSRNVIVSSGATSRTMLRGPYDIICLGAIFGLNEEQAKNAVLNCGRNVFLNSVSRRLKKTAIFVENVARNDVASMEVSDDDDDEEETELHQQKKSKQ